MACFALGGVIYGPFIPITYAQYQSATTPANLPAILAARSAIILVSTPLGTAIGGPLVGSLGAAGTLVASGALTVLLAVAARFLWAGGGPSPWAATARAAQGSRQPDRARRRRRRPREYREMSSLVCFNSSHPAAVEGLDRHVVRPAYGCFEPIPDAGVASAST
jgi:hypothetical protein